MKAFYGTVALFRPVPTGTERVIITRLMSSETVDQAKGIAVSDAFNKYQPTDGWSVSCCIMEAVTLDNAKVICQIYGLGGNDAHLPTDLQQKAVQTC